MLVCDQYSNTADFSKAIKQLIRLMLKCLTGLGGYNNIFEFCLQGLSRLGNIIKNGILHCKNVCFVYKGKYLKILIGLKCVLVITVYPVDTLFLSLCQLATFLCTFQSTLHTVNP